MKKVRLLLVLATLLGMVACNKDGDWGNDSREEMFGFVVERDAEFPEQALNKTTYIKTKIKANYKFDKIPMEVKVNYRQGGSSLSLNGIKLEDNTAYLITNSENTFEYVGKTEGSHNFVIIFINDKGVKKEEEFRVNYAISDFNILQPIPTNPNQEVWQGDEYSYNIKIDPTNPSKPINDYEIKFDVFDGEVKMNGNPIVADRWYPIFNLSNNLISMKSNGHGNVFLNFSVKNGTTERNSFITQRVKQREININSLDISDSLILLGSNNNRVFGHISKKPATTNNIFYKTWLSNYQSGYSSGITLVNDYVEVALNSNNSFQTSFNVGRNVPQGRYTLAIQFKDEYGNESEVKTFDFRVTDGELNWSVTPSATANFEIWNVAGGKNFCLASFNQSFNVSVNRPNEYIVSIKYKIKYTVYGFVNEIFGLGYYTHQHCEHGYHINDGHSGSFIINYPANTTNVSYIAELHDFSNINETKYKFTWLQVQSARLTIVVQTNHREVTYPEFNMQIVGGQSN